MMLEMPRAQPDLSSFCILPSAFLWRPGTAPVQARRVPDVDCV